MQCSPIYPTGVGEGWACAMSDHALAVVGIIITISLTLTGCGVAALTMTNHPDKVKAAKVFFSAAAIASLFAGYFWTASTTYGLFVRFAVGVLWLTATVAGLIVGFRLASRSSLAELQLPASAFTPEPLWPQSKKLVILVTIGILAVIALVNATRTYDPSAIAVILWREPWRWVLPALAIGFMLATAINVIRKRRQSSSEDLTRVNQRCSARWLHAIANNDRDEIQNAVMISGIQFRNEIEEGKRYIDFVFSIFNKSVYEISIDDSIGGDIIFDGEILITEKRMEKNTAENCHVRGTGYFIVRQYLNSAEIDSIKNAKPDRPFRLDGLIIKIKGGADFPDVVPKRLRIGSDFLSKASPTWFNYDAPFRTNFEADAVANLKAEIDSLKSQLATPLPQTLPAPGLRCDDQHFDDVRKSHNYYIRVSGNSGYKAAFLDFKLNYDSTAGDSLNLRAEIIFTDGDSHVFHVRDGIWHGRDLVKVPIRHGETQSLILTTLGDEGDFTTYESQRPRKPIERTIKGNTVRAEVVIWPEYINKVMPPLKWYFELSKVGGQLEIRQVTADGLARQPDVTAS
jgi:hypothetical protein